MEDGGDDDRAAEEGPVRGAFAEKEEDPDGIEDGLDVADDAGVERCTPRAMPSVKSV